MFVDGSSGPTPATPGQANQSLQELEAGSPWLAFGGITAPFAGLFNIVGSTLARTEPNAPAELHDWPLLPANLKPPVRAETSPPGLVAAQAHLGRLAASGDPRGWTRAGELTPIKRFADMFSGTGLTGLDGTAWYHPRRLTIDSGAVAAGNANPAQQVLDVKATHGDDLDKLRIYAFAGSLGAQRVIDAAKGLARESGIPRRRATVVNRAATPPALTRAPALTAAVKGWFS